MMRIGAWSVDPATYQIACNGQTVKLEARTMRLLLCLAERAGETISADELIDRVWPGTVVSEDSFYQAVTSLRRVLGDDPKNPTYIVTVPRRGYRMVATVSTEPGGPPAERVRSATRWKTGMIAVGVLAALVAVAVLLYGSLTPAAPPSRSVAVLPFLDLTSQAMNEEYFADGMTEELIDRLTRIPGLKVPSATESFYFKGRQLTLGAIAKQMNVRYILDGSVRRSGATLRVAARLVRAGDGFVVWSEAYDRQ